MTLYIDPGTGSMLFALLIGLIGAAVYSVRMLIIKIRYRLSGKKVETSEQKIPFVIYSDDKRYWNVFEPICKEMNARGKEVVYLTGSEDDPVFTRATPNVKAKCIGRGHLSFAHLNYLNASIVLSTTPGLDVYQWKRSKDVDCYVHIPHAAGDLNYRMFGLDYYDAVLLSGDFQAQDIRALEALRGLPAKDVELVGIPYMDVMAKRLREEGPAPEHPRTILIAPSWGSDAMFQAFGDQILAKALETGYHVIVRPHPQSFLSEKDMLDRLMSQYPETEQLEWNRDNDNFDVLRRSDILITDFSGVIFEFALVHDKPVIYTEPKLNQGLYDTWWLNKPLWNTSSALPRLGVQLTDESLADLKGTIDACLTDTRYAEGRRAVKAETWVHEGEGAVRTVDWLLHQYDQLTTEKEAN